MKNSHFTIPRTLGDCAFVPSADPIERHTRPRTWLHLLGWATVVVLALVAAGCIAAR